MRHALRVVFRTGGSRSIGLGHVRRCISLARALTDLNGQSSFLLDGDPEVLEIVETAGYRAVPINRKHDLEETVSHSKDCQADVVVMDSYSVSIQYLDRLRDAIGRIAVIDDLGGRELPADLVINGSAGAHRLSYRGMTGTTYLLGPQYILLRSEFAATPPRTIAQHVDRVLITVGGSDPNRLTMQLMRWTADALKSAKQDVVVGPLFEDIEILKEEACALGDAITLHEFPQDMRGLMVKSDLALCAGGQTTYELAATGTPAVAVRTAENQTLNLEGLMSAGSLMWIGNVGDADLNMNVTRTLNTLTTDTAQRALMSRAGLTMVDGRGTIRVAQALQKLAETSIS